MTKIFKCREEDLAAISITHTLIHFNDVYNMDGNNKTTHFHSTAVQITYTWHVCVINVSFQSFSSATTLPPSERGTSVIINMTALINQMNWIVQVNTTNKVCSKLEGA